MSANVALGAVSYVLARFVMSVSCGVLEKHVTKYEGETVVLSCFTDLNEGVEWVVRSEFHRHLQRIPEDRDEYRRIYSIHGLQRGFNFTGRYSVSEGNGYYNLTIKNLNITENGKYSCIEDRGFGRSSSTQLSVNVNVSLLQTNRRSLIIAGNNVTLPCSRQSDGPIRWLYVQSEHSLQDVISKDNLIQSKYTDTATIVQTAEDYNLSLHNVQLNQSGFYICIEDGLLFFKTSDLLTVLVPVKPYITEHPPTKVTFKSGKPVTLKCRANGSAELVYSWKYNGTALTVDPGKGANVLPDGSLELMNPQSGTYQCFVSNRFGEAASAKSLVIPEPEDSQAAIIIGVVLCLASVIVLFVAIVRLILMMRTRQDKSRFRLAEQKSVQNPDKISLTGTDLARKQVPYIPEQINFVPLKRISAALVKLIEPNFGLIHLLYLDCVLKESEEEKVLAETSAFERNEVLMKILATKSRDQRQDFISTLYKMDQSHVANFMQSPTSIPTDSNDWPLDDNQMSIIDENKSELIKFLDTDSDLLGEMRLTACLSVKQIDYLLNIKDDKKRSEEMIEMLKRRSVAHFNKFLECLEKFQRHLVPFFTGDEAIWREYNGTMRPLNDEMLARMSSSWKVLAENIDWTNLLAELYSQGCITKIQYNNFRDDLHKTDRNKRFLQLLTRKSIAEFNRFMRCLDKSGQSHLVPLFTTDSVAVEVHAILSQPSSGNIDSVESKIESRLQALRTLDDDLLRAEAAKLDRLLSFLGIKRSRFSARRKK